ncbi:MAG: hypothetical protein M3Z08_03600 [Chloroflexota bacterium]|nr:hypothetical protein [Chloroflexota bacterium]
MIATQRTAVVGVFEERSRAEQTIDELKQAGFRDDQIGFVVRDRLLAQEDDTINASRIGTGGRAATGAITGGVIGGVLSVFVALLLPGFGTIFAGGIMAAALSGVVLGAMGGGFLGALTGAGVPEEHARFYVDEVGAGRTIVLVKAHDRVREATEILNRHGAYDATTGPVERLKTATPASTEESNETQLQSEPQPEKPGEVQPQPEEVSEADIPTQTVSKANIPTQAVSEADIPTQKVDRRAIKQAL